MIRVLLACVLLACGVWLLDLGNAWGVVGCLGALALSIEWTYSARLGRPGREDGHEGSDGPPGGHM